MSVPDKPVTRATSRPSWRRSAGVADDTTEVAEEAAKTRPRVRGLSCSRARFCSVVGATKKSTIVEVRRILMELQWRRGPEAGTP